MQHLTRTEGVRKTHAASHQDRQTETLDLKWNYNGNEEGERLEGSYFYCEAL